MDDHLHRIHRFGLMGNALLRNVDGEVEVRRGERGLTGNPRVPGLIHNEILFSLTNCGNTGVL